MSTGPVEAKVKNATGWAAVTGFIIWVLETYAFPGLVPVPVQGFVDVLIPAVGAFVGGYLASHTPRDDPDARRKPHLA